MSSCANNYKPHVVLFPFMSKGHTIPILDLARLLAGYHNATVTLFTTPSNRPFIAAALSGSANVSVLDLPFPKETVRKIPFEVESTDKLPSMSLFNRFAQSTELIKPHFEKALEGLSPRVDFVVSDMFLWWTLESSKKYGIPRLVFFGTSSHFMCMSRAAAESGLTLGPGKDDDELISLPQFPMFRVSKRDFDPSFGDPEGLQLELAMKFLEASSKSSGYVMNSFYELEPLFVNYWNENYCSDGSSGNQKLYCVGPLCMVDQMGEVKSESDLEVPVWVKWLDGKMEQKRPVLYVAFGSQAEVSLEQIKEIALGLAESEVNFLWVIRKQEWEVGVGDGFQERIRERGLIVRDWVDQRRVLAHPSVEVFLSHCGWNSVLESICAGVPILAWPMLADQRLNARMVVDVIKVGLRVETCDGSANGLVKWEVIKEMVNELMAGEKGKEVREKVKVYEKLARKAMEKGPGSSWKTLRSLIEEMCEDITSEEWVN